MSDRREALARLLLSRGLFLAALGALAAIGGLVEWTIDVSPNHGPRDLAAPTVAGAVLGAIVVTLGLATARGTSLAHEPRVRRSAAITIGACAALLGIGFVLGFASDS